MTRMLASLKLLTVVGAVAVVACGPRLKPVEYEEPTSSAHGSSDEGEASSSSKSSKTSSDESSSDSSSSSSSASSSSGSAAKGCEDKNAACGTPCTECPPGALDCMEVLIAKQCNAEHKCVAAPANCTSPDKGKKGDKKASKE